MTPRQCPDLQVAAVSEIKSPVAIQDQISKELSQDSDFEPIMRTLLGLPVKNPVPSSLLRHYSLAENQLLLYDQEHLCIPRGPLRTQIPYDHHDTPVAGHQGIERTFEAIHKLFYWPKMNND